MLMPRAFLKPSVSSWPKLEWSMKMSGNSETTGQSSTKMVSKNKIYKANNLSMMYVSIVINLVLI